MYCSFNDLEEKTKFNGFGTKSSISCFIWQWCWKEGTDIHEFFFKFNFIALNVTFIPSLYTYRYNYCSLQPLMVSLSHLGTIKLMDHLSEDYDPVIEWV